MTNIKFQTLIRKFRNGIKDTLDKKKIIDNYTYQIFNEEALITKHLLQELQQHIYTLRDLQQYADVLENSISTTKKEDTIEEPEAMLFSFSPAFEIPISSPKEAKVLEDVSFYMGEEGYLKNIYNTEYCNDEWIIMMYFMNRLYTNFSTVDKIKIKSLHILSSNYSTLSAIHHFLYNSKINNSYQNIEWKWLATSRDVDLYAMRYEEHLLKLLNDDIKNINNAKFIINETLRKGGKMNFLCIDSNDNTQEYLVYLLFMVKLLENNSILYMMIPNPCDWTINTFNALMVYSMVFYELYIFSFDFICKKYTVLIGKNKKKINSDSVYKKIVGCLEDYHDKNILSLDFIKHNAEMRFTLNKLFDIKYNRISNESIVFDDMIYEIYKVLELNRNTFL